MQEILLVIGTALAAVAAGFSLLAFLRVGRLRSQAEPTGEVLQTLRAEADRTNQINDDHARKLRQELIGNLLTFQETTLRAFRELSVTLSAQIRDFGERLDGGVKAIDARAEVIAGKLDENLASMGKEANLQRDALRQLIEVKLDEAASKQASSAKEAREEIAGSFKHLGSAVDATLGRIGEQQKEQLEGVTRALSALAEKQEKAQEALREVVERRLDAIRTANEEKLEQMRRTVDEKLQSTLEARLGQSFQLVSDQLQKVSAGLGEMQQLATGVGDLKRVLTQVKPRGIWGEAQLESLLEDFLAPDQFARNVAVRPESSEHVEFAIRLPRLSDGHGEVYLPIDAKFPHEAFDRLIAAADLADSDAVEVAARALERALRQQAKDISTKYICPPNTTDYAILFLPSEALYAEIARRPGLVEALTRECSVMIAGPSTLIALLNAIRVGFRSALIHRQAGEVSKLLQKVRVEFDKYGTAVQTAAKRAASTVEAIAKLQTRQNVMGRALKGVDLLAADTPLDAATMLLEIETHDLGAEESAAEGS